jgi:acetyl-CoA acyltransferase 1
VTIVRLAGADVSPAAGTRQVVTGLAHLRRTNQRILCTTMCVGSGMGAAGIFVNEAV